MKRMIALLLLGLLILSACSVSKYNESSTMTPNYGKLKLVGDPLGREVYLNGEMVKLDEEKTTNIFELLSGTYSLEIRAEDVVLLQQKVLISTGQTNEIKMP